MARTRRRSGIVTVSPTPAVTTGFRLLPRAVVTRSAGRVEYLLSGSFASEFPAESVTLYQRESLIGRIKYWCPPGAGAVMHNLGALRYSFAFGVWLPSDGSERQILTIEALDCAGNLHRREIRSVCNAGKPDEVSIVCEEVEPLAELPTDPPMVVQLEQSVIAQGTVRLKGWIVSRTRLATSSVKVGGASVPTIHRDGSVKVAHGYRHYPNANAAGFTAEVQLTGGQQPTQAEVIAVSEEGAEYQGVFPIDRDAVAVSVSGNLTPVGDAADRQLQPAAVLYVEYPAVENGVAVLQERQQIRLAGWAVALGGIERLDIYVDGRPVGKAAYGLLRPDVARVLPRWPHAERSGFSLQIDQRNFLQNPTTILLDAHLISGHQVRGEFQLWFGAECEILPDALISDVEIWRFARTVKMFARGQEDQILTEIQGRAARRHDTIEVVRVQQIRRALSILEAAWIGNVLDQKIAQYLKERGYL
jgi:hypothetical protein